jgi:hypothetical protein
MESYKVAIAMIAAVAPATALADNYSGRIRLTSFDESCYAGSRFLISQPDVSLFARSTISQILVQAFLRKALVDISYSKITCPCTFSGVCGRVQSVTLDAENLP